MEVLGEVGCSHFSSLFTTQVPGLHSVRVEWHRCCGDPVPSTSSSPTGTDRFTSHVLAEVMASSRTSLSRAGIRLKGSRDHPSGVLSSVLQKYHHLCCCSGLVNGSWFCTEVSAAGTSKASHTLRSVFSSPWYNRDSSEWKKEKCCGKDHIRYASA
jgi:hypothetical protein